MDPARGKKARAAPDVEERSSNLIIFGLQEESGSGTVEASVRGVLDSQNEKPVLTKSSRVDLSRTSFL